MSYLAADHCGGFCDACHQAGLDAELADMRRRTMLRRERNALVARIFARSERSAWARQAGAELGTLIQSVDGKAA